MFNVTVPPPNVPVSRTAVPSRNVRVPVAEAGDTVALRVTVCPSAEGFGEEVKVVVVGACPIVWVRIGDVLVRWFVSPE
jgi:hypothetical protein